ncbi:MAG: Asp-tRNA(Asn)/Glu-tRNA(Gln) amidotransferase subunit GatC [Candidatus Saccharibacteria bacterium]|nr:Asp-tRNA(Asn)/Glu-tRNA(Gln) amidotransferase subunit GatC [Candidatus Saccharibacteria bacterium]
MDISRADLKHLANLSNFSMSDEELDSLSGDLKNIVSYISELNSLDTEGVEPTYQVFEMENVWRDDEIKPMDANREELLDLTTEEKDHQIKVPKVL